MNKILPSHTAWFAPALPVRKEQGENFAEKLDGELRETGRQGSSADHPGATKNPIKTDLPESGCGTPVALTREAGEHGHAGQIKTATLATAKRSIDGSLESAPVASRADLNPVASSIRLLAGSVAWARVYPEHLIAGGYLSIVGATEGEANAMPEPTTTCTSECRVGSAPTTSAVSREAVAERSVASLPPDPLLLNPAVERLGMRGADAESRSSPAEQAVPELADHIWAQRMVRLTHDGHGGTTVWLRDYALNEKDLTPVASKLSELGREDGFRINRIVINGREIWRAVHLKKGV